MHFRFLSDIVQLFFCEPWDFRHAHALAGNFTYMHLLFAVQVMLTARACWLITRLGRPEKAADPAGPLADLVQLSHSNASRPTRPSISPAERKAEQCAAGVPFGPGAIRPTTVSPHPYVRLPAVGAQSDCMIKSHSLHAPRTHYTLFIAVRHCRFQTETE